MTYILTATVPVVTSEDLMELKRKAGRLSSLIVERVIDCEAAAIDYAIHIHADAVNRSSQNACITGTKSVTKSADGTEWVVELTVFD